MHNPPFENKGDFLIFGIIPSISSKNTIHREEMLWIFELNGFIGLDFCSFY